MTSFSYHKKLIIILGMGLYVLHSSGINAGVSETMQPFEDVREMIKI